MEQRSDVHVVFRNKQAKEGPRGTELQTMKSRAFFSSS